MKKEIKIGIIVLVIIIVVVVFNQGVFASEDPTIFIVNDKTKECGVRESRPLPEEWTFIEPNYIQKIQTPYGNCEVKEGDDFDYKSCCESLGFDYVDYKIIPHNIFPYKSESRGEIYNLTGYECVSNSGRDYREGLTINEKTKSCSELIIFTLENKPFSFYYAFNDECVVTDKIWVGYKSATEERIISKYGECYNFNLHNEESVENCCENLGLNYVNIRFDTDNKDKKPNYLLLSFFIIIILLIITYLIKNKIFSNKRTIL